MKFSVIKQADVRKEARKGATPTYKFSEEFIADFNEVWEAMKDGHHLDKVNIPFENTTERNKWLRLAKAYGDTRGIYVSHADVEDTKTLPVLHIRMEDAEKRDKRIAEREARNKKLAELKKLGGVVKRGKGNALSDAELDKEIKRLQEVHAKADTKGNAPKTDAPKTDAPKTDAPKRPTVPPVPGLPKRQGNHTK